ncbi:MAG: peptidase M48, partial [Beggiatoa sp. IS2]
MGTGLQIWLAGRQMTHIRQHQDTVPPAFAEKITLVDHQKAAAYTFTKVRFGRKMLIMETFILLFWTIGGLLQILDLLWRTLEWSPLWTGVAVLTSFMLVSAVLDLPANIYKTFYIEARFGFNRTSVPLFIGDTIESLILFFLIGIPLTTVVLGLMEYTGELWWLWVWGVWMGFSLLMLWAYPAFIAPLFNKFVPLEEGE